MLFRVLERPILQTMMIVFPTQIRLQVLIDNSQLLLSILFITTEDIRELVSNCRERRSYFGYLYIFV